MLDWLTARPVAHRGLHDATRGVIENTASAFTAALEGGYAIECDLQVSADGEAMVHHDDTLGRLIEGSERLDRLTAAELMRRPYRDRGDRMLSLGELCDLVSGHQTLVIELKSRFDGDMRLVERTGAVLAAYRGPVAVMSFDPAPIAALRRLYPTLTRGLVAQRMDRGGSGGPPSRLAYAAAALKARLDFLAYRLADLETLIPRAARQLLGMPVLTWTVRTPQEHERTARLADQIIFEGFRP